jgi:hypothetical protein
VEAAASGPLTSSSVTGSPRMRTVKVR